MMILAPIYFAETTHPPSAFADVPSALFPILPSSKYISTLQNPIAKHQNDLIINTR